MRRHAFALCVLCAACQRTVFVGHSLPDAGISLSGAGGSAGSAGTAGAAGETATAGEAGSDTAAGAGGEAGSNAVVLGAPWSAQHETGDISEWQGVLFDSLQDGSGSLKVATQYAHSGRYALDATISPVNDTIDQTMIGRRVTLREGVYSAWYYLPQAIVCDYWVLMKLSSQPDGNRFDIDVQSVAGDAPRLRLYEHGHDYITAAASVPVPVGHWFQIEVDFTASPNADGRLIVRQDGVQLLDTGPRVTMSDDRVIFFVGSASRYVSPAPFSVFIDDAAVALGAPLP